jgi:anti-anti-sigma factor
MSRSSSERSGVIVSSLREPVSLADERWLRTTIGRHLRDGRLVHVVDLLDVEHVGTHLMQTLLALFNESRRVNGIFALVINQPPVLDIFAVTGLDGIFPIFAAVAEAVRAAEACARDPNLCLRARAATSP